MLLIAASLALLVVYAGVKLLIQSKRETLGNLYKCAAWFFIVSGFFTLFIAIISCIAMFFMHGAKMMMMHKEGKMMMHKEGKMFGHDSMCKYNKGSMKMMKCKHGGCGESCSGNCCGGCNDNMNYCRKDMGKCCSYMDYCKPDSMKNAHKP